MQLIRSRNVVLLLGQLLNYTSLPERFDEKRGGHGQSLTTRDKMVNFDRVSSEIHRQFHSTKNALFNRSVLPHIKHICKAEKNYFFH